jgi:transcriptional regulator with XRE-family HTH domain
METADALASIAHNALAQRTRIALSQQAVADSGGLEIVQYQRLERGEGNPTLRTLVRAATGLGIPLDALVKPRPGIGHCRHG